MSRNICICMSFLTEAHKEQIRKKSVDNVEENVHILVLICNYAEGLFGGFGIALGITTITTVLHKLNLLFNFCRCLCCSFYGLTVINCCLFLDGSNLCGILLICVCCHTLCTASLVLLDSGSEFLLAKNSICTTNSLLRVFLD